MNAIVNLLAEGTNPTLWERIQSIWGWGAAGVLILGLGAFGVYALIKHFQNRR